MGSHKTFIDGETPTTEEFNYLLDHRVYATKAELDTAAAGWGSAEVKRMCWVTEENRFYYWDGSVLVKFPSTGGAGAPVDATYVTTGAEPGLNNEALHKDLVGVNLHVPKVHSVSHGNAGSDQISVEGLTGLLADEQNAGKIKSKTIDALVGNRFLYYDGVTMTWASLPGGGDMTKAVYDTNDDGVVEDSDKLEASTKAQVQDHTPKVHKDSHKTGGSDALLVTDALDALARVEVKEGGVSKGKRRAINLIAGAGIAYNITDDAGNEEVDVNISVSGGGTYKLRPKVTVYKVGSYYYAMDEDGVLVDSGTDATTVIKSAIGDLTGGRTWRETVALKGSFTLTEDGSTGYCINEPTYTILDLNQAILTLDDNQDCDMIQITGGAGSSPREHSEIWGGRLEGNKGNQTSGHGIVISKGSASLIRDTVIYNCDDDGLNYNGTDWGEWAGLHRAVNVRIYSCDRYGVYCNYHNDNYFDHCVAQSNGSDNVYLYGIHRLFYFHSIYAGRYSFHLPSGCDGTRLIECDADTPTSHNIYIGGDRNAIVGGYIHNSAGNDGVRFLSGAENNNVYNTHISTHEYAVNELAGADWNHVHGNFSRSITQAVAFTTTGGNSVFTDNVDR